MLYFPLIFSLITLVSPQSANSPAVKQEKPLTDFETDKRLNIPLSLAMLKYDHAPIWTRIDRRTGVLIEREDAAREFDTIPLALGGKGKSARAWMDAIAARVLARWEKTEKNGYRFLVSQNELDFIYLPKDEWAEARYKAAADFIRDLEGLPANEQTLMTSNKSFPVSSLPESMQKSLVQMLDVFAQAYEAKGKGKTVRSDQLDQAQLRIERNPAKGFNSLFLTVIVQGYGSSGFHVNDYEAKKKERIAAHGKDPIYTPVRFEVKPENAKTLPALKRVVRVNMQGVTFPQVMKQLHAQYGIAFVSDSEREMPEKANVVLEPMPLWKLLDELTKIYSETEWEWRKYGFIVVRGPENQIRKGVLVGGLDKKKNQQSVDQEREREKTASMP